MERCIITLPDTGQYSADGATDQQGKRLTMLYIYVKPILNLESLKGQF